MLSYETLIKCVFFCIEKAREHPTSDSAIIYRTFITLMGFDSKSEHSELVDFLLSAVQPGQTEAQGANL